MLAEKSVILRRGELDDIDVHGVLSKIEFRHTYHVVYITGHDDNNKPITSEFTKVIASFERYGSDPETYLRFYEDQKLNPGEGFKIALSSIVLIEDLNIPEPITAMNCPFCDGVINPDDVVSSSVDVFYVCCRGCGARGPVTNDERQAIVMWNNRHIW